MLAVRACFSHERQSLVGEVDVFCQVLSSKNCTYCKIDKVFLAAVKINHFQMKNCDISYYCLTLPDSLVFK